MRNNVSPAMIMVSVDGNIDQCVTGENLDSIIFQTIYIIGLNNYDVILIDFV